MEGSRHFRSFAPPLVLGRRRHPLCQRRRGRQRVPHQSLAAATLLRGGGWGVEERAVHRALNPKIILGCALATLMTRIEHPTRFDQQ
jgi:hypothetical protein